MRLHGAHRRLIVLAITLVIAGGLLARATLSRAGQGMLLVRGNAPGECIWTCSCSGDEGGGDDAGCAAGCSGDCPNACF